MNLEIQLSELAKELPWVKKTRLIIGPLISRELVKDHWIEKVKAVPGQAVIGLQDLANEILSLNRIQLKRAPSEESKTDLIQALANRDFIRNALPELTSHLSRRDVATKIKKFIDGLDRSYVNRNDLQLLIEYFGNKSKETGEFLQILSQLWDMGECTPWTEAGQLRKAIQLLNENQKSLHSISKIQIIGFEHFRIIEQEFIETLANCCEVELFVPETTVGFFKKSFEKDKIKYIELSESINRENICFWKLQSPIDEM